MKDNYRIIGTALAMVVLNGFMFVVMSQEADVMQHDTTKAVQSSWFNIQTSNDTVAVAFDKDSILLYDYQLSDSIISPIPRSFKPNPNKAVLYSALFPGLGQIYNRKYWKLPIVYGGFMGLTYAITWNNKNLQDYGTAYKDLSYDLIHHQDDPESWHQSWKNFIAAGVEPATRFTTNFRDQLKRGRDLYRRNRDLCLIMTAGLYLLCMADAYVDAQLFDFDISEDLSMRLEPVINPGLNNSIRLYGLNCSIKF